MSLRVDDWRLPVAVPWDVNPEFGYRFDDADTAGLGEPRDWTIVCVATLPKPGRANGTINFFAPIVVNEKTGVAAQIENRAGGYSTREPFTLAVAS
jgi:flagellar assembly factor FliW